MDPSERRVALFGALVQLPSLVSVEAVVRAGFDFVALDIQHGTFGLEFGLQAIQLLDTLGVESFARVALGEFSQVPHLLDFGAGGVILANVEDAATVGSAIKATRYQPAGTRSYGQQRYGLKDEPTDIWSVQPKVIAMIETRAALDNLEAIAAVPELDGLLIGPADLALALGVGPGEGPAMSQWRNVVETIRLTASRHSIEAWMATDNGEDAALWARAGFDRVLLGSDVAHLRTGLKTQVTRARESLAATRRQ